MRAVLFLLCLAALAALLGLVASVTEKDVGLAIASAGVLGFSLFWWWLCVVTELLARLTGWQHKLEG